MLVSQPHVKDNDHVQLRDLRNQQRGQLPRHPRKTTTGERKPPLEKRGLLTTGVAAHDFAAGN